MISTIDLLPKQYEFVRSCPPGDSIPHVLYSGAFAAGKTRALCVKLAMRACVPGARELLVRKTRASLVRSTLRTLLESEGGMPPVLPEGSYKHNKVEGRISIIGGGEIVYFGAEDQSSDRKGGQHTHGSVQCTGVAIDEWVELTERETSWLVTRARLVVPGLRACVYGATNPGPMSHHLAASFGVDGQAKPQHHIIMARADDNTFLPTEYIAHLNTYSGLFYRRYVLGEWCSAEGLVYSMWDRTVHTDAPDIPERSTVLVGVDDGYKNPFACVRLIRFPGGRLHVDNVIRRSELAADAKVRAVAEMVGTGGTVIIDPSAAWLAAELSRHGIHCVHADNAVLDGVRVVSEALSNHRLTVHPSCVDLISEIEAYAWSDSQGKEAPRKRDDHACDALRYAVVHASRPEQSIVVL